MAIGALGTGSGIDLESLVNDLVSSQRDSKKATYDKKIDKLNVELSAIGSSSSAVVAFNDAVKKLNNPSLFSKRKAEINQPESGDVVNIKTNSDAISGRYDIEVLQKAHGSRMELLSGAYKSADDVITDAPGTLKFAAGKDSFTVKVEAGTTLSELAALISKAKDNFGVTTSLIDTGMGDIKLIIMSDKKGAGNDLFISSPDSVLMDDTTDKVEEDPKAEEAKKEEKVEKEEPEKKVYKEVMGLEEIDDEPEEVEEEPEPDPEPEEMLSGDTDTQGKSNSIFGNSLAAFTRNLVTTQTASNGAIAIEGTVIQSKDNNFDKAIKGLKIEALKETTAPVSANITYDTESVKDNVKSLVESYNKMITTFNGYTGMNGTLQGNSLIRGLEGSLVNTLGKTFSNTGSFTTLFDIGIKLGSDGQLNLDDAKLDAAITSGFGNFADMFTGEQGIASAFQQTLTPYTGADGLFRSTQDSLQDQISGTEESLESFEQRMDKYEERLRKQYTRLDTNLAEMNANGDYLRSQLATLNK